MSWAFSLAGCCCCPQCAELESCTACGDAEDRAARYEVIVEDYPAAVECAFDPPGTPCDLSGVNGTYELAHQTTVDASTDDVLDIACVYTGAAEIGLIPGGCFGTGGGEHSVTLELTLTIHYTYDRRFCACATTIRLEAALTNALGLWDRKAGGLMFERSLGCDELAGLELDLVGAIGDCFLGPVRATVSRL